ncbi:MarR family winged helix-turn-helix transcriptional regulator [Leifsonia shinshuensis]|uniref:DNA-binding MarR family transcriptional regulator n=1 Tax=Leifsonia shinshuensis TaxID=150026 RepID=A0A853CQZ9_9MICO|nr:MarR family winged helix-turn-helix transcriptional regulator [Leifsonia shinshuensis]NYJ22343.1 DNA-binding MarR family transcriptional regulator [Leifsonia shinshuensis]
MAEDRQEQDRSPEADVVALIERSLVAVRRDQSRRRPMGPWDHGGYPGRGHGPHDHTGTGPDQNRTANGSDSANPDGADRSHSTTGTGDTDPRNGAAARDRHNDDTDARNGTAPHDHHNGHSHPAHGFDPHAWGARGPWGGGFPGPFGDSARPGPGRRGRDGSLGRFARIRMLEALAAADAEGRQLSVSSLATAIGVDQPRASRLVQEGVERGLVRRIPDPSDARRALIQLTTAGRSQLGEVQDHRRSAVETALASFTPEEARTFAELFARFVQAWPR